MEFEPNQTINDEARILAQAKKLTLNPVDPFLKPQDAPNPVVVPETHANIDRDSESTADSSRLVKPSSGVLAKPTQTSHHPAIKFAIIISSVTVGVVAGASYFFFLG
ncbi:MAG: hypothetical protein JWM00_735 [Candidatus Saccharibacteria bacterium]|nr:hypothetical protein [Candidatus Saccharibacteria bacterium]